MFAIWENNVIPKTGNIKKYYYYFSNRGQKCFHTKTEYEYTHYKTQKVKQTVNKRTEMFRFFLAEHKIFIDNKMYSQAFIYLCSGFQFTAWP